MAALAVAGVFADVDRRALALIHAPAVGERLRARVVVVVHHVERGVRHALVGDEDEVRVLRLDRVVENAVALVVFRPPVLVADLHVFQAERLGVAVGGAQRAVFGGSVAADVLNAVERVLQPPLDLLVRARHALARLAGHAAVHHIHEVGAQILAELAEFQHAQAVRGAVAPQIPVAGTILHRAARLLPVDGVLQVDALHHAAAGEAQEAGAQAAQHVHQIAAEAVGTAEIRVLREERGKVHIERARFVRLQEEARVRRAHRAGKAERQLLEFLREGELRFADHHAAAVHEAHRHVRDALAACDDVAVVVLLLHRDAAIALVHDTHAAGRAQHVELELLGARRVARIFARELHGGGHAGRGKQLPAGQRVGHVEVLNVAEPRVHLAAGIRCVFRQARVGEAAVAQQLGIDAAVARVVDLLIEDAPHARIRRADGLLRMNGYGLFQSDQSPSPPRGRKPRGLTFYYPPSLYCALHKNASENEKKQEIFRRNQLRVRAHCFENQILVRFSKTGRSGP